MPQFDSLESRLHLTAGYLDRGFAGDGKLSLPAEVRFSDVLATDNGSVVVAGISSGTSSSSADASSLYLRQYRKTGAIDRNFGDNGTVRMSLFAGIAPNIARPQLFTAANDRILVTIGTHVVRLQSNGLTDATFSGDGIATVAEPVTAAAVDSADRVLIGTNDRVTRLSSTGIVDSTFATNGSLSLPLDVMGDARAEFRRPNAIVRQSSGRILISGHASIDAGFSGEAIVRLLPNGTPDQGFGDLLGILDLLPDAEGSSASPVVEDDDEIIVAWTHDDAYVTLYQFARHGDALIERRDSVLDGGGGYIDQGAADIKFSAEGDLFVAGGLSRPNPTEEERFGDNTSVGKFFRFEPDQNFSGGSTAVIDHTLDLSGSEYGGDGGVALALTSDGDIVVLSVLSRFGSNDSYALARIDGNGDAAPPAYITGSGTVVVTGTTEDDYITIESRGGDSPQTSVRVNQEYMRFDGARRVLVDAGAGDDRVLGNAAMPFTLLGGRGDDTLFSSRKNDILSGGEGDDNLQSNGGDDVLEGGAGDDILRGGDGSDTLTGGDGRDRLYGDAGDDLLIARGGNTDRIDGGEGIDAATSDKGPRIFDILFDVES